MAHPEAQNTTTGTTVGELPQDVKDVEALIRAAGNATPEEIAAVEADIARLRGEIPVIYKETKAGYKTTEFWTSILAGFLDVATQIPFHDKIVVTVLTSLYAIARGLAKRGVPDTQPVV